MALIKSLTQTSLFINWPSPGSPLVIFEKWMGNPGYLIPVSYLIDCCDGR